MFFLSRDFTKSNSTILENAFIEDCLPELSGEAVKLYLYGLCLASQNASPLSSTTTNIHLSNSTSFPHLGDIADLVNALYMTEEKLKEALQDLELAGLIEVRKRAPLEIYFIQPSQRHTKPKKYTPSKYTSFNSELQALFPSRMLSQSELLAYYDAIESMKIDPKIVLLTAEYCITLKGGHESLSEHGTYRYILAVVKNWVNDGATTPKAVEAKINELQLLSADIRSVFIALGKRSTPDYHDKELLAKWTKSWSFTLSAVVYAASKIKSKGGSMTKLDSSLCQFLKLGIFTESEMEAFTKHRKSLFNLAVSINKTIGTYYEDLEPIIENYTSKWLDMGFSQDALLAVAKYCFLKDINKLSAMNTLLLRFYKEGRVSVGGIHQYIDSLVKEDEFIKDIYVACGIEKNVIAKDRETVNTWTASWGIPCDLILYAAELAKGKAYPIQYMNQILSAYKENGITTVEQAQAKGSELINTAASFATKKPKQNKQNSYEREYTKEELNALFDDIMDIKYE